MPERAEQRRAAHAFRLREALEGWRERALAAEKRAGQLEAEIDRLRDAAAANALEIARLQEKDATLAAIEAGGWWRLRARVLPVLRIARHLDRTARRRTRGNS